MKKITLLLFIVASLLGIASADNTPAGYIPLKVSATLEVDQLSSEGQSCTYRAKVCVSGGCAPYHFTKSAVVGGPSDVDLARPITAKVLPDGSRCYEFSLGVLPNHHYVDEDGKPSIACFIVKDALDKTAEASVSVDPTKIEMTVDIGLLSRTTHGNCTFVAQVLGGCPPYSWKYIIDGKTYEPTWTSKPLKNHSARILDNLKFSSKPQKIVAIATDSHGKTQQSIVRDIAMPEIAISHCDGSIPLYYSPKCKTSAQYSICISGACKQPQILRSELIINDYSIDVKWEYQGAEAGSSSTDLLGYCYRSSEIKIDGALLENMRLDQTAKLVVTIADPHGGEPKSLACVFSMQKADVICWEDAKTEKYFEVPFWNGTKAHVVEATNIESVTLDPAHKDKVKDQELLKEALEEKKKELIETIAQKAINFFETGLGIEDLKGTIVFDGTYQYPKGFRDGCCGTWPVSNLNSSSNSDLSSDASIQAEYEGNLGGGLVVLTKEIKLQARVKLAVGVSLEVGAKPSVRPTLNKPSLTVFTDLSYVYKFGYELEGQTGWSIAIAVDKSWRVPGSRIQTKLVAGKHVIVPKSGIVEVKGDLEVGHSDEQSF